MAQGVGGGPKPRPHYLKIVRGSGRKGRPPKPSAGPRPVSGRIEPPDFLSGAALEEFRRLEPELSRLGFICPLDRGPFSAYCVAYGRWRQAETLLKRKRSLTTQSVNGQPMTNPLVAIARHAALDMLKFGSELGLTAIARRRLGAEPPAPDGGTDKYF